MRSPTCSSRRLFGRVALTAFVLSLPACGGGDSPLKASSGATTTTPTTAAVATTAQGPATTLGATTSTTLSGNRSQISTTTPPLAAAQQLDRTLIPENTASYDFTSFAMNGISYVNGLMINAGSSPAKVEINAGRSKKRFLGVLGIPDNDKSSSVQLVEISLDNAAPVLSTTIRFGETKDIDLDVTNVLRIRVVVTAKSGEYGSHVGIGNGRFT
jgi:hypothetical protein